jgi:hypothetical protein
MKTLRRLRMVVQVVHVVARLVQHYPHLNWASLQILQSSQYSTRSCRGPEKFSIPNLMQVFLSVQVVQKHTTPRSHSLMEVFSLSKHRHKTHFRSTKIMMMKKTIYQMMAIANIRNGRRQIYCLRSTGKGLSSLHAPSASTILANITCININHVLFLRLNPLQG